MPRIQGHSPAGRCLGVLLVYGVRGSRGDVHDSPMIVLDGLLDGLLRRLKSTVDKTSFSKGYHSPGLSPFSSCSRPL